ncbi:Mss4-like protein [Aspergillus spinulosporus]
MAEPTNSGSCLCGAVQYLLYGKPLNSAVCHCDSCQQFTGSAFVANCWYKEENVKLTRGDDSIQTYNEQGTTTGQIMKRSFCKTCGSSLFMQTAELRKQNVISVTSGTMDDRTDCQPGLEVWCANRRGWVTLNHQGERLERQ